MQYKHTQGERHIVLSSCQCFLFFAAKQAEEVLQQLPSSMPIMQCVYECLAGNFVENTVWLHCCLARYNG